MRVNIYADFKIVSTCIITKETGDTLFSFVKCFSKLCEDRHELENTGNVCTQQTRRKLVFCVW